MWLYPVLLEGTKARGNRTLQPETTWMLFANLPPRLKQDVLKHEQWRPNPVAEDPSDFCKICHLGTETNDNKIVVCETSSCRVGFHQHCLTPALLTLPLVDEPWFCATCSDRTDVPAEFRGITALVLGKKPRRKLDDEGRYLYYVLFTNNAKKWVNYSALPESLQAQVLARPAWKDAWDHDHQREIQNQEAAAAARFRGPLADSESDSKTEEVKILSRGKPVAPSDQSVQAWSASADCKAKTALKKKHASIKVNSFGQHLLSVTCFLAVLSAFDGCD